MATSQPVDCSEAIHWFVNNVDLHATPSRGVFASDFSDAHEPVLESALGSLEARGINAYIVTGETLYQQADELWQQALRSTKFGRPVLTNAELEMGGSRAIILKNIDAPEAPHHLWYLFHHILYPAALSNKPLLITTHLGRDEFVLYGAGCEDVEYAGRKVTWEKVIWLINALTIDLNHFQAMTDLQLPPMLRTEYALYQGLKERGLPVHPQHVLGEYMLDIAAFEPQLRKRRDDGSPKLDIECDILSTLDGAGSHGQAKRSLLLLNDGWNIVRFSIGEIESDLNGCVDAALEVWQQGRKKSLPGRLLSGQAQGTVPELPVDDDVQRLAITHGGGPAAVDGGAGTGKSSCVTHRVGNLLAQGISPEKILVLSHSNETLRSLKSAVELLGDKLLAQRVNFFSWHDFGHKVLKENLSAIKRKPPLKTENNPQKVIQRLLAKYRKELDPMMLELSEELDEFTIASLIALYKANLIIPKHLKERCKTEVDELVAKVFQGYEEQLLKSNKIDRDDMISLAALTLADQPDVRSKYQFLYEYVLTDEYQEATAASDLMMRLLAFPQDNLFVAGNEDEAIYESKGGLPRLMSELSIKLPNARCYMLEKNWRSHPTIVDCSKQLLRGLTRRRIQKDMTSGWGVPPAAAIVGPQVLANESAESEWVANEVSILIDSGRNPQDIAVLYRYHRYGLIVEESMSQRGIRCVTTHPEAGMIPDEVGDVMAFLRLVMDPDGPKARESFERVCQLRVKEVDPKLSTTIAGFAEANNLSYLKAIEIYSEAVAEPACKDLEQLVRIIRTMHSENTSPGQAIALWKRTQRLNEYYKSIKVPPGVNYEPMRKLAYLEEEAFKFKTVSEFVKSQTVPVKPGEGEESDHVVHILTLHEAKGKEFPVVFLVGLAEGLFPAESATDREEERRLCYVGFSRAKELLYLSYPAIFNEVPLEPSSFLFNAGLMSRVAPEAAPAQPAAAPPAVPAAPTAKPGVAPAAPLKPAAPVPQQQPVMKPATPVPQQQQPVVKPATPVPQQQQPVVKPATPVPQQPQTVMKPAAAIPQQPQTVMKPAAAIPQQPQTVVKPATPVPQQQQPVMKPATPVPQQQQPVMKPATPVPQQQQPVVEPAAPVPQQQQPVPQQPQQIPQPPQPVMKPAAPVPLQQPAVKPVTPVPQQLQPVTKPGSPLPQQQPAVRPTVPAHQMPQQVVQQPAIPVAQQPQTVMKPAAAIPQQQQPAVPVPQQQQQPAVMQPSPQQQSTVKPVAPAPQPESVMQPAAHVSHEKPVQAPVTPGLGDIAFKGEKTPPAMSALNREAAIRSVPATTPQPTQANSWQAGGGETRPPQQQELANDPSAAVHIKPAPAAHSPYIPARPGMPRLDATPPQPVVPPVQPAAEYIAQPEMPHQAPPSVPQQSQYVQPNVVPKQPDMVPGQPPPAGYTQDARLYQEDLPEDWFDAPGQTGTAANRAQSPMGLPGQAEAAAPIVGPPPTVKPEPAYDEFDEIVAEPAPNIVPAKTNRGTKPQAKPVPHQEQPVSERPDQAHPAKRALPTDTYWQKRRSSNQPEPQAQPEPPVPVLGEEIEELDTNLERAPASGYLPPPGHATNGFGAQPLSAVSVPDYVDEGDVLEQFQPPQDAAPTAHSPATPGSSPQCPQCAVPLEPGSRFCGECGYQLPAKIPACHLCGAPLEPSAKFCGECGSPQVAHPSAGDAEKPTQRSWLNRLTKLIDE